MFYSDFSRTPHFEIFRHPRYLTVPLLIYWLFQTLVPLCLMLELMLTTSKQNCRYHIIIHIMKYHIHLNNLDASVLGRLCGNMFLNVSFIIFLPIVIVPLPSLLIFLPIVIVPLPSLLNTLFVSSETNVSMTVLIFITDFLQILKLQDFKKTCLLGCT